MNALVWFEGIFSVRLLQTLLHFLWIGSLIAGGTAVIDRVLRNSTARVKYVFHVAALLIMLACLPVTFVLVGAPRESVASHHDERNVTDESAAADANFSRMLPAESFVHDLSGAGEASVSKFTTSSNRPPANRVITRAEPASRDVVSQPEGRTNSTGVIASTRAALAASWLNKYAPYFSSAYLAGVILMSGRLLIGLRGGTRLRRTSELVRDPALVSMVVRQSRRIGLRFTPALAYCREISVPVVTGVLRPMILLPATLASGLSPDQLQALVMHELAHLRRFDPIVNLLQRLIEAILFFHPAVWYVSRRIDAERENASDDLVLAAGFPRLKYADALVRMAELSASLRRGASAVPAAALAASGGSSSEFKRRVLRLLGSDTPPFRISGWGVLFVVFFLVIGTAALILGPVWAAQPPATDLKRSDKDDVSRHAGRRIENFRLRDYLGTEHQLKDFAHSRLVVVAFLGVECPLAKLYGPRLTELFDKYKQQNVTFLGIDSNQQDTPTEIGHYVRSHGIKFPMLKDPGNKIADQFGAERTPEVFVLDEQRVVRYWGNIDDQFGVGFARPAATNQFLAQAMEELLQGKSLSRPENPPIGCRIGRVARKAPTGEITYTNQVSRILQRRCFECHRDGGIAPFAMNNYEEVAGWAESMREAVEDHRMPPWHANPKFGQFSNDHRMPDEEKQILFQWIENGVPEGAASDLPDPVKLVDGWSLGQPDLVVSMPESFTVPRDGVVSYQYFTVDPGFKEGKWIRASEVIPGVRSVVHHVIVFINPPGGDPILEEKGVGFEMVGSYVPGTPPMQLEEGVARYVPAGSTFVFQLHYTPDGSEQKDQTKIGLYYADPASIRRTVQTGVAANTDFTIPAQTSGHRVEAGHRFNHDTELYALTPHMHYRGKSFRFEAIYPNGSREILLDVPRFDFNWQNTYRLAKPKLLPEGTLLKCFAVFDNSENNLSNPDPTIPVKWGEQTWEEMMIGYVECVFLNQDLSLPEPQITPLGNDEFRVRFAYRPDRPVRSVHLAGTFNEWNTSSNPLEDQDRDGVFTTDVTLKKGPQRYKFVVDGNYWTHDPASRILTGFFHESFFVAGNDPKSEPASKP